MYSDACLIAYVSLPLTVGTGGTWITSFSVDHSPDSNGLEDHCTSSERIRVRVFRSFLDLEACGQDSLRLYIRCFLRNRALIECILLGDSQFSDYARTSSPHTACTHIVTAQNKRRTKETYDRLGSLGAYKVGQSKRLREIGD